MPDTDVFAYDRVEYPDQWHPQTYPDRLATLATLFGMQPAPPDGCRVLEIGCGRGMNLIAMAHGLPGSTFVGIDRAAKPLEQGREMAERLGLRNVTLQAYDLMDVDEAFGTFDYIVAHGLYSWVPAPVRDRLLALCKAHLAPQGVAYVSYNTYPGKYLSQMLREMMQYYVQRFDEPHERAGHARAFLRFLRDAQKEGSLERLLFQHGVDRIEKLPDNYFYHDDLADVNEPCYFHEFVAHAGRHGLQYLAEANFHEMSDMTLPDQVAQVCSGLARDHNEWEQLLDIVVMRQFRQTLLCHDDVALSRAPDAERMRAFFVGAPVTLAPAEPSGDGQPGAAFKSYADDTLISVQDPILAAALLYLRDAWPRFVAFDELLDAARRQVAQTEPERSASREEDAGRMGLTLLKLFGSRFLSLRVHRREAGKVAGSRPVASSLARLQLRMTRSVSNLVAESVTVEDPLERLLLPLLDGTNDREALLDALAGHVAAGDYALEQDGVAVTDPAFAKTLLAGRLEAALEHLAHQALIVA